MEGYLMNRIVVSLIWISLASFSHAQESDLLKLYKAKFPDAPAVFVERSELLSIFIKNDSLEIFGEITEDILHLKEQTDAYSTGKVYGSHFNQVKDLKAKTLIWDRNRFKEMHVTAFNKKNDQSDGIFYDDSYNYTFNFPSVSLGNRTHLQYRTLVKDARFMPGYVFTSYIPQGKATFTIKTTKEVDLFFDVINDDKASVKFRKYEKGPFVFYEWTATDLPARKAEDESPSVR